jgi:NAD(P)-dependent dehydrogenase (short-subunit alcohol dehydrogenase family)
MMRGRRTADAASFGCAIAALCEWPAPLSPVPLCTRPQNLTNPELIEGLLARTPMQRLAEPEDVAGAVSFLCSPAAAYVTGQTLAVDGGYSVMGYW